METNSVVRTIVTTDHSNYGATSFGILISTNREPLAVLASKFLRSFPFPSSLLVLCNLLVKVSDAPGASDDAVF